jgi:hypothetical protein
VWAVINYLYGAVSEGKYDWFKEARKEEKKEKSSLGDVPLQS